MISCVYCSEDKDENRKMYNINVVLPNEYRKGIDEGIICGVCLYEFVNENLELNDISIINDNLEDLEKQALSNLFPK